MPGVKADHRHVQHDSVLVSDKPLVSTDARTISTDDCSNAPGSDDLPRKSIIFVRVQAH